MEKHGQWTMTDWKSRVNKRKRGPVIPDLLSKSMIRVRSLVFRAVTETDSYKVVSVVCFLGSKKFDILSTFLLL